MTDPMCTEALGGMEPCTPCGAKPQGEPWPIHYTVICCEKCRDFFEKRGSNKITECPLGGKCDVSHKQPRKCQQCRNKRCLAVGMAKRVNSKETSVEREMPTAPAPDAAKSDRKQASERINLKPILKKVIPTSVKSNTVPTFPGIIVHNSPSGSHRDALSRTPDICQPTDGIPARSFPFRTAYVDDLHHHTDPLRALPCQLCAGEASSVYREIYVCQECLKFSICQTDSSTQSSYSCRFQENCDPTVVSCNFCQYKRCVELGMMMRERNLILLKTHEASSGPCKVCNAEGTLFGIWTCKSCKGFFWHNDRVDTYTCLTKGKCDLEHKTREACKPCQMTKSLAVKMRRINPDLDMNLNPTSRPNPVSALPEAELKRITKQIVLAHQSNWDYTKAKMSLLSTEPFNLLTKLKDDHVNKLNAWQLYSSEVARELEQFAVFVRNLPRIGEIKVTEQATLLKNNYFFVYLVRIYPGLTPNGLMLHDGRLIDFTTLNLIFGTKLAAKMLEFAKDVAWLQLSDDEVAYIVVCLLFGKSKNSHPLVKLGHIYMSRGPYKMFEQLIPDLEKMQELHNEQLNFLQKNVRYMTLCPMFMALFDIKSDQPLAQQYQYVQPSLGVNNSFNVDPLWSDSPSSVCLWNK